MIAKKYGNGTRLDPPVVMGGTAYGMAWKFSAEPSLNPDGQVIGTAVVASVQNLGAGRVRIVCKRDYQFSDYDISIPGEGSMNVITQHLCGGNVCDSLEWMRAISHANPLCSRGSLAASRAIVGDGVRITRDGKKHTSECLRAEAYAHRPSEVNFAGESVVVPPTFFTVGVNDVGATRTEDSGGLDQLISMEGANRKH